MRVRRAFWIGAAGAGLFLLFLALSLRLFVAGGIGVGDPLPEFVLYTLDGEAVTPESWRGRPAVLSVFLAGCTACADDFELLGALQAELGQQALVAAVQVGDTPAAVRAALRGRRCMCRSTSIRPARRPGPWACGLSRGCTSSPAAGR